MKDTTQMQVREDPSETGYQRMIEGLRVFGFPSSPPSEEILAVFRLSQSFFDRRKHTGGAFYDDIHLDEEQMTLLLIILGRLQKKEKADANMGTHSHDWVSKEDNYLDDWVLTTKGADELRASIVRSWGNDPALAALLDAGQPHIVHLQTLVAALEQSAGMGGFRVGRHQCLRFFHVVTAWAELYSGSSEGKNITFEPKTFKVEVTHNATYQTKVAEKQHLPPDLFSATDADLTPGLKRWVDAVDKEYNANLGRTKTGRHEAVHPSNLARLIQRSTRRVSSEEFISALESLLTNLASRHPQQKFVILAPDSSSDVSKKSIAQQAMKSNKWVAAMVVRLVEEKKIPLRIVDVVKTSDPLLTPKVQIYTGCGIDLLICDDAAYSGCQLYDYMMGYLENALLLYDGQQFEYAGPGRLHIVVPYVSSRARNILTLNESLDHNRAFRDSEAGREWRRAARPFLHLHAHETMLSLKESILNIIKEIENPPPNQSEKRKRESAGNRYDPNVYSLDHYRTYLEMASSIADDGCYKKGRYSHKTKLDLLLGYYFPNLFDIPERRIKNGRLDRDQKNNYPGYGISIGNVPFYLGHKVADYISAFPSIYFFGTYCAKRTETPDLPLPGMVDGAELPCLKCHKWKHLTEPLVACDPTYNRPERNPPDNDAEMVKFGGMCIVPHYKKINCTILEKGGTL